MIAWVPFVEPLQISATAIFWLLLPLLLAVAIVYKAVRSQDLHRIGIEIAGLMLYMVAGLTALGAGLWLVHTYWP
jgi:hypothetical protein